MKLRDVIKRRKDALRKANPKSRDRLRHNVVVAEKALQIKRELRAA